MNFFSHWLTFGNAYSEQVNMFNCLLQALSNGDWSEPEGFNQTGKIQSEPNNKSELFVSDSIFCLGLTAVWICLQWMKVNSTC